MRRMDLVDEWVDEWNNGLSKIAYQARAKSVLNSLAAQRIAINCAKRLRKTCKPVVKRKGTACDV